MTRAEREARAFNAAWQTATDGGAHPVAAARAGDAAVARDRAARRAAAAERRALARQREADAAAHFAALRAMPAPPA